MKKNLAKLNLLDSILVVALLLVSFYYFRGISQVPFHPDESTQIYMSGDFDILISNPQKFLQESLDEDIRQTYRKLDSPITRYMIGVGRYITGNPDSSVDWDWSLDWDSNKKRGALPDQNLLNTSRLSVAILFPISLMAMYAFTKKATQSKSIAIIACLLLATNSLILLHTRRAMAESVLIFTVILFLFIISHLNSRYWLLAFPAALAFNAKQSTVILAFVGMVYIFFIMKNFSYPRRNIIGTIVCYILIFTALHLILNPYLWDDPIRESLSSLVERKSLIANQKFSFSSIYPGLIESSFIHRSGVLLINLFLSPPSIAETGNYIDQLRQTSELYLSNPLHSLFRGLFMGGLYMLVAAFGFILTLIKCIQKEAANRNIMLFVILTTMLQFISLGYFVHLPLQRYVVPLVPYACFWTAVGLYKMIFLTYSSIQKSQQSNKTNFPK